MVIPLSTHDAYIHVCLNDTACQLIITIVGQSHYTCLASDCYIMGHLSQVLSTQLLASTMCEDAFKIPNMHCHAVTAGRVCSFLPESVVFTVPTLYYMACRTSTMVPAGHLATANGAVALLDNFPSQDSTEVAQAKAHGAIILAHGNMAEWAFTNAISIGSGMLCMHPCE